MALSLAGCILPGKQGGNPQPLAKPAGGTIVTPVAFRVEGKVVRTNPRLNFVAVSYTHLTLPTKA